MYRDCNYTLLQCQFLLYIVLNLNVLSLNVCHEVPIHSEMGLVYCSFTWMAQLHYAE